MKSFKSNHDILKEHLTFLSETAKKKRSGKDLKSITEAMLMTINAIDKEVSAPKVVEATNSIYHLLGIRAFEIK